MLTSQQTERLGALEMELAQLQPRVKNAGEMAAQVTTNFRNLENRMESVRREIELLKQGQLVFPEPDFEEDEVHTAL